MSQLSSNRLWETGVESSPSQYTRMIPGTPALPSTRFAPPEIKKKKRNARHVHRPGLAANENIRIQPERKALTSPAIDNMSFELLAWDSVALAVALAATTSLIPGVVPWNFLPIMVALVILLGFCEGVYTNGNAPYAAGIIPALFRSTLFASGLVYIAQLGFKTCITIFSSAFVGLTFVRCVLHHFWKRNDQGAVARKVLIVGGGMIWIGWRALFLSTK